MFFSYLQESKSWYVWSKYTGCFGYLIADTRNTLDYTQGQKNRHVCGDVSWPVGSCVSRNWNMCL